MAEIAPPQIAVLSASLGSDSNSRSLCWHACEFAKERGIEAEFINLQDHRVLPYFEEGSEGIEEISAKLDAAAAIIVSFPLYNYNMSASLKALIEHCGNCFEDKVVGIMTAAGGQSSYMSVMSIVQSLMCDYRSWIIPRYVYAARGDFEQEGKPGQEVRQRIEQLVEVAYRTAWQHKMPLPERVSGQALRGRDLARRL